MREQKSLISDLRVRTLDPLPAPRDVRRTRPLGPARAKLVRESRQAASSVLRGDDDRLLVIVGPCSVHDPVAALDYARRLAPLAAELADELVIVMRVYFEKPRTTVGWKGLINDPNLDGSHDVLRGLRIARDVLLAVLDAGLPIATEFLEPTSPQYTADAITWGAIGARNVESQVHRQLASGLSMPVGLKNSTDGDVQNAIDAAVTAAMPHTFFGVDSDGRAAAIETTGNPDCHIILRGGAAGPNYSTEHVEQALAATRAAAAKIPILEGALTAGVVIDASHGNSGKSYVRQAEVVRELAARLAAGEQGISGLMMESFIEPGAQAPGPIETLVYGQSVTDECLAWDTTADLLRELSAAVKQRRK